MACYKIIIKNVILISLFYSIITVSSKKEDEDFENCMDINNCIEQMVKHCDSYKELNLPEPNTWHCVNRAIDYWLKVPSMTEIQINLIETTKKYLNPEAFIPQESILTPLQYCFTYNNVAIVKQCLEDVYEFGVSKTSALNHALYNRRTNYFNINRPYLPPVLSVHFGLQYMGHLKTLIKIHYDMLKPPFEYCRENNYVDKTASTSMSDLIDLII